MKKKEISFADMERMLEELAQFDQQEAKRLERARGVARNELNRLFFRRRCLCAASGLALIGIMGAALALLLPEESPGNAFVASPSTTNQPNIIERCSVAEISTKPLPEAFSHEANLSYDTFSGTSLSACYHNSYHVQALPVPL